MKKVRHTPSFAAKPTCVPIVENVKVAFWFAPGLMNEAVVQLGEAADESRAAPCFVWR